MTYERWREQDWAKELIRQGYAVPPMHPDAKAEQLSRIMECLERNFPERFGVQSERTLLLETAP